MAVYYSDCSRRTIPPREPPPDDVVLTVRERALVADAADDMSVAAGDQRGLLSAIADG